MPKLPFDQTIAAMQGRDPDPGMRISTPGAPRDPDPLFLLPVTGDRRDPDPGMSINPFTGTPSGQISYPPDQSTQAAVSYALDLLLPGKILDAFWNNVLFFSTTFESPTGYSTAVTGTGAVTVDVAGLYMKTGATSASTATFSKKFTSLASNVVRSVSWTQPQRFRVDFEINSTSNSTAAWVRGGDPSDATAVYYGFRLTDGTLAGICRNGGTESTVTLATLSANVVYVVEAHLLPGSRILFYLRNNTGKQMDQKGILTTNLPVLTSVADWPFFYFYIKNTAAANKEMQLTFFEYAQLRDKF